MSSQTKTMNQQLQDSYLAPGNEAYLENLYESYLENPDEVDPKWRSYFDNLLKQMKREQPDVPHSVIQQQFYDFAQHSARITGQGMEGVTDQKQELVLELISAYRRLGHLQAKTDPLNLLQAIYSPSLELAYYGFSEQDMQRSFSVGSYTALGKSSATLTEIFQSLRQVYCGTMGVEYMHINRSDEVEWIRARIEDGWAHFNPPADIKKRILDKLVIADGLEKYLGFKYVGQKRFSLEGGDSLVPMLDAVVSRSAEYGVHETVIGMAHRGRLNVLVNIVGKDPKEIFAAFEGKGVSTTHSGDVKYHLGAAATITTAYGPMRMVLAFNPSHLEIVSPVVQGNVRARQRRRRDTEQKQVLPIQIHGDAAFAGQGVVMETFNMSQARWFTVGGSLHIVINNQVGFTTSNPKDSRSTTYCTDIAKMVEAPILHVNGNDPEAVYFAGLLAIDYRNTFKRDVVIDLVCYRRHGHNEADEPSATQPMMYKVIKAMPAPYQLYEKKLLDEKVISDADTKKIADDYRDALDNGKSVLELGKDTSKEFAVDWEPFAGTPWDKKADTSVPMKKLKTLGEKITELPQGFVLQPQVNRVFEAEKKMVAGEQPLNWGFAENMAYATLLDQGYPVRLCGQDAGRGTFAHRHAVLYDQNTGTPYIPLSHISSTQAQINIVDSLLSEEAVLGFEYGYASAEPNFLVLWEAQFGDFANGAQVVIDQFISSGEQKWGNLCNLVMLLPHGYEGMGPEHSSARLERYLQLCAQDNIQVCVPSLPSQIFHLLRRQMIRPYRKPLIVMTPKSLLRHPEAVSSLKDLSDGSEFQLMIPDTSKTDPKKIDRVVICCGKVYYELMENKNSEKLDNVAIVRIEQLYPFPEVKAKEILKPYAHVKEFIWCQEEPQNQGAWFMMNGYFTALLGKEQNLRYAGRPASASPAAGYHSVHEKEQEKLITQALTK